MRKRQIVLCLFVCIAVIAQFSFAGRYYDARVGRFLQVDPKAQKYPNLSVYSYCADNPLKNIDPDGKELKFYGNLLAIHTRMYNESATYRNMVDRVNERIGKTEIPVREASLKEINKDNKEGTARGLTTPGKDDKGNYTAEGTRVLVGDKTDLVNDVKNTKSQTEIIAHELTHVDQITADPTGTKISADEENNKKSKPNDRPLEVNANTTANEVMKEIEKSRKEEQDNK